jgi:hypothetical protein
MSRKKLTLSVEERLTRHAKFIAKRRGTSVSSLVETFFTALEEGEDFSEVEEVEANDVLGYRRGKSPEDAEEPSSTDYEVSEWARRWRGAFAKEGKTYPDDKSWEEEVLSKEIEKKHVS